MITENGVIYAVRKLLQGKGFKILKISTTYQRGDDILAEWPATGRKLVVEAKGQTSSKKRTSKYKREFDKSQKKDHLGKAILKCLEKMVEGYDTAMAFPSDDFHRDTIKRIRRPLKRLGIKVFLVKARRAKLVVGKFG